MKKDIIWDSIMIVILDIYCDPLCWWMHGEDM